MHVHQTSPTVLSAFDACMAIQVIEVVHGCEDTGVNSRNRKLIVFVHGGAWGSGCTWSEYLLCVVAPL